MKKKKQTVISLILVSVMVSALGLQGCAAKEDRSKKTEIEIVQYKLEAVKFFEEVAKEFNATQDEIHLTIDSPNEAMVILKTRFVREDEPDIIGIGGDINYSYFLDSDMLADISDFPGNDQIKPAYKEILKGLEFVPREGEYGVPYAANAAGVLYNREMFKEYGWEIPETWTEFMNLCEEIQAVGIQPLYFGFKDTWTCLAPWNSLAVDLSPTDICRQVNRGEAKFEDAYQETAEKMLQLLPYGPADAFAYGYNDACTAFANGESAMYTIGSYAVPQIKSVNPEMDIDSFVMPGNDDVDENILNSGVDLQFCVMESSENKEAAYKVLAYLMEDENVQKYLDNQNAVPCKDGEFRLASMLDGVSRYIEEGKMSDYQDHYYPSEMAVDAQIQTLLIQQDVNAFLKKFDKDWVRYNRDIIHKVQDYEDKNSSVE